jgi:ubiquinone biosynthesis protein
MRTFFRLCEILFACLRFKILQLPSAQKQINPQNLLDFFLSLGPLFIKLGQVISTRPDLIPPKYAEALSHLQDRVPPISFDRLSASIPSHIRSAITDIDPEPIGSGSIAQVHAAKYQNKAIVIKILRPNVQAQIKKDIKVLHLCARLLMLSMGPFRQLQLKQFVNEFEYSLKLEIDLRNECANLQTMKINFENDTRLYIPDVFPLLCDKHILCLEKINGVKISEVKTTCPTANLKELAETGVKIFFTQVLRDRFFHADMHPGNIFVNLNQPHSPQYVAIDFGIVGSLSVQDTYYLGANFRAFFHRNYHEIARLHLESGWVKGHIRIDHFEQAIRAACDPIYAKPIHEISFGQVLGNLIDIAKNFELIAQPQLLLLQKTLLNVEGLGRQIYPELNLWYTAKPLIDEYFNPLRRLGQSIPKIPALGSAFEFHMNKLLFPTPSPIPAPKNHLKLFLAASFLGNIFLCALLFY